LDRCRRRRRRGPERGARTASRGDAHARDRDRDGRRASAGSRRSRPVSTLLHAGALVLAAIAAGAPCAGGRRTRPAEAAAGFAMLVGMTDAMTVSVLPAALWSAVLLAAAIALAVRHRWTAAVPVSPVPAEPGGRRAPVSGPASAAAGSRSSVG